MMTFNKLNSEPSQTAAPKNQGLSLSIILGTFLCWVSVSRSLVLDSFSELGHKLVTCKNQPLPHFLALSL